MSGFISPEGQFYECPFEGHDQWSFDHMDLIGKEPTNFYGNESRRFQARGWIRVSGETIGLHDYEQIENKISLVKSYIRKEFKDCRGDEFRLKYGFSVYVDGVRIALVNATASGRPDFSELDAAVSSRSGTHRYRG